MAEKPITYYSFMLRLWQVQEKGKPVWRASLESPMTGELRGFQGIKSLYAYLRELTTKNNNGQQSPH